MMKLSDGVYNFMNNVLAEIGLILVFIATGVPFFLVHNRIAMEAYPYVYAAGAICCLVARSFVPYRGSELRIRRWYRIQFWSAVIFCAGAVFLFCPGQGGRDWIAFTLAGAVLQFLSSVMIIKYRNNLK